MACSCSACSASSSIVGEAASSGASDAAVARARGDLICWSRRWAAAVCSLGAARAGEVCLGEWLRASGGPAAPLAGLGVKEALARAQKPGV